MLNKIWKHNESHQVHNESHVYADSQALEVDVMLEWHFCTVNVIKGLVE